MVLNLPTLRHTCILLSIKINIKNTVKTITKSEGTSLTYKCILFWDVSPHISVEIRQRFRGKYSLHHQG
jgi:hypothetical protein